jgi:hypothetical protein
MITPSHCGVGGNTPLAGMLGMDLVSCAIRSPELAYHREELFPWGFELMSTGLGVIILYTMSAGCKHIALYAYTLQTWYIWQTHCHCATPATRSGCWLEVAVQKYTQLRLREREREREY